MPGDASSLELWITCGALAGGLGLSAAMAWLEHRPRKGLKPRLLPTTPFLLMGGLVAILALVHLVNLWGIHTGRF
jgi:hypothetical protein